ncbi:RNA 2'-phosphotransferase [Thioclava sp. DLFJ4-1]|uniref:RNA 2'-phosphotransferase n=1 Tax=Thioclava sp. DLFJ4-1 TaxID=1915313 RepID=UPI0009962613|nr:RNA 2'-phosphotransferase [Thioclava sp. DLFJ4-1]OOY17398.1 RNA--NAD 2'-phosphotransferase [Thioclava sp. DLFJ4-1]
MSRESKFLARILRHKPEDIGVTLDAEGWVRIDLLLRAMKKAGRGMTRAQLEDLVETNDKRRFTIQRDKIRAAQGHSIPVDLGLQPLLPPELLYHGTASQSLDAIFASGLLPGGRRHVHLSGDPSTAAGVGKRHGKPTVLQVEAGRMHGDGYVFCRADNGVWLTDHVPPEYLGFGIRSVD